ncbi:MAG: glycine cleavage system aminomethyltransferase GcvT [Acidobacteria bacterium]|nr:glycine cleavage system aminomethyltransferase GcvT [Acidobacteriota bacterium]
MLAYPSDFFFGGARVSDRAAPSVALRRTALYEMHRRMGARMVEFGGWEMPLEYTGILAEHLAVRLAVGVFDVSHMGEIEVEGPHALALLQKLTCNDVSRLAVNQAQYSGLMNERGGLVDDLLVHRLAEQHYLLCVNAARREVDFDWICRHNDIGAQVRNTSDEYTQLAVQGPRSIAVVQPLASVDVSALRYYGFARGRVCGIEAMVARTGYTGEDGFEIYLPVAESERIWNELLEAGKKEGLLLCGLGARNTLRLEAGMLLYGHDMNETTTPLEVNLRWICKLDKGPFLGREVLLEQARSGLPMLLVGFQMTDRAIARDDAPVWVEERQIGLVTSGSYAPFLKKNIGLAYVAREFAQVGQPVQIEIRGTLAAAEVVPTPFYRRSRK